MALFRERRKSSTGVCRACSAIAIGSIDRLESEDRIELPAFSYIRTIPGGQAPENYARSWLSHAGSPLPAEVRQVYIDGGSLVPATSFVPAPFLVELYRRLREERLTPEAVWLFRFPALFWKPAPGERSVVEPLEQRARQTPLEELDRLTGELQRLGLFDVTFAAERADALRDWSVLRLIELQKAGLALVEYLYSAEHRAVRTPPDYVHAVEASPVALAVFASPATPWPEAQRHRWLADLLRSVDAGAPAPGYELRCSLLTGAPRIDSISPAAT